MVYPLDCNIDSCVRIQYTSNAKEFKRNFKRSGLFNFSTVFGQGVRHTPTCYVPLSSRINEVWLYLARLLADWSGASNVNFRKLSVRKAIWDLEFSEHFL